MRKNRHVSERNDCQERLRHRLKKGASRSLLRSKYPLGQDFSRRGNLAFIKADFPTLYRVVGDLQTGVLTLGVKHQATALMLLRPLLEYLFEDRRLAYITMKI